MESLKLLWLGPPRVELKGLTVKLETRKDTALLAYLSLHPDPCPREILAALFWAEGSQQRALGNLRRALSSIKSRLPGWIEANNETISLKKGGKLWGDITSFHRSLGQVQEHCQVDGNICDDCLSRLDEANSLYRGDFLEGLNLGDCPSFDDWQFFQRDSLRQELAQVLQRLSAAHAGRGNWDQAILPARRWLAQDRLCEPACRNLIDLFTRCGQPNAALREYEELERRLRQAGQEPEDETCRLIQGLKERRAPEHGSSSTERTGTLPILKTKLYLPSPPSARVRRSELMTRLNEVEHTAITIISAPAGFGKTTLLAEWVAATTLPAAWLSLDQGDNDPYRFLSYLTTALESIHEDIGSEARQMMASFQLLPAHIILASLINDLTKVIEPHVLVLDDYQFISEHAVHEAMAYFLDHLPANTHLVIATRADPPLQLGRMRAHGKMIELRTRDLRFSIKESTEFLNNVMHLSLKEEDIEALEARTEGWVVGLKMAALSLRGHADAVEFIRAFSGSHRYVLDYLMEEVLKRQSPHIHEFLLYTSILDKLNSSLCTALMPGEWKNAGESVQEVLEYLEKSNLFLIPLDDEQNWYRYHHLFCDLLRSRLQQLSPDLLSSLHLRASIWFEQNGYIAEALLHAIRSGDFLRAAGLIEKNAPLMLARHEFSFYLGHLNAIPTEVAERRPWLVIYRAWLYARLGQIAEIEPLLKQAERSIEKEPQQTDTNEMEGCIALVRANMANLLGNSAYGIEQAMKAQRLLPANHLLALDNVGFQRGFAHFSLGDWSRARQEWKEVVQVAMASGDYDTYSNTMAELADIRKFEGRLHEAYAIYEEALHWLRQQSSCLSVFLGSHEIGSADVLVEWNRLDEARRLIQEGIQHAEAGGRPNTISFAHNVYARLLLASNDREGAWEAIRQAESIQSKHTLYPRAAAETAAVKVKLWIAQERWDCLQEWIQAHRAEENFAGDFQHESVNITQARALFALRNTMDAYELLCKLRQAAEAGSRTGRLIEIIILQALCLDAQGNVDQAIAHLSESLQLAEPHDFMRVFLDEGEPLQHLLQQLAKSGLNQELEIYINRLRDLYPNNQVSM